MIISDKNWKYCVHADYAEVIEKVSYRSNVSMPDFINGIPVRKIAPGIFWTKRYCKSYTYSVVLPHTIEKIDSGVFEGANRIERIRIPGNVWHIESGAFRRCVRLHTVKIEDGCKRIAGFAFAECPNLRLVEIPATVEVIEEDAFAGCADELVIYGRSGTFAERYALEQGFRFDEKQIASWEEPEERRLEIKSIKKETVGESIEISFDIETNDGNAETLWYRVNQEYEEYICDDRCDCAVVSIFASAMKWGYEVICSPYPISEKLYYGLTYQIIPQLYLVDQKVYPKLRIEAPLTKETYHGPLIAAGMSGGVDSFATLYEYGKNSNVPESYKLNTLVHYQVGAHNGLYYDAPGKETQQELYDNQMALMRKFSNINGYRYIAVASNLAGVLRKLFEEKEKFPRTIAYRNAGATMLLQKGISRYYVSSSYNLDSFTVSLERDMTHYEKWVLPYLNTGSTEFYQTNQNWSRQDKIERISEMEESYDFLQVCLIKTGNCGTCEKCKRTLMELDVLGDDTLERYRNSFDLATYRREHRDKWFSNLFRETDCAVPPLGYREILICAAKYRPELLEDFITERGTGKEVALLTCDMVVRELPVRTSEPLFFAYEGDNFPYLGMAGRWVAVQMNSGETGYIFGNGVTVCDSNDEPDGQDNSTL